MSSTHTITFVLGATATGKSTWALNEAERAGGEILNADSVQVYKYLDIGSAKPPVSERKKRPHHLYDLIEPSQVFTAGEYRRRALEVITSRSPHAPLFVVGGSGFYVQALDKGMFPVRDIPEAIKLEVDGIASRGELFARLKAVDEKTALKHGPNDHYRNRRALEVSLTEGRPVSLIEAEFAQSQERLSDRYTVKKVGLRLERERLRRRIETRVQQMLDDGLIDEVRGLIDRGYAGTKALSSVGYKECVDHLAGRLEFADLASRIVTSTMQLAKRQETWFKRDREITWISPST